MAFVNIRLQNLLGESLRTSVRFDSRSTPFAGSTTITTGRNISVQTDSSGEALLTPLQAGDYNITVLNQYFFASIPDDSNTYELTALTTLTAPVVGGITPGVTSVHGRTGIVVGVSGDYDADQITETATNKIFTAAERTTLASLGGASVTSVFGRAGVVVATSGDYDADEITETASNKIMTAAERIALAAVSSPPVDSVFGRTGVIVATSGDYDADEIAETASNKIMTAAERTKLSGIATGADVSPVTSVLGRTGIVVAATNDYTWAQIDKTTSDLADITTRSHASLTLVGTNTHAQIDTHIAGWATEAVALTNKTIDADNNTITNLGFSELDTDTNDSLSHSNGSFLDSPSVTVASDGVTITLTFQKTGGGDVRAQFSSGVQTLDCTPAITKTLTAGTMSVPVMNHIFLLESDGLVTVNTSGFPAVEHARIASVYVQTGALVQTNKPLKVHAWTDHTVSSTGMGHISDINYWIRNQPATWLSGVTLTPTVGASTFDIATTAGNILQLHEHTYPAFDTSTGSTIHVANDSTGAFSAQGDLLGFVLDADGNTLQSGSTDFFNLVIWGAVNEATGDCQIFVNLPSGAYANDNGSQATLDTDLTAIYAIPSAFTGVGFLISRLTIQTSGGGPTYTLINHEDLRGSFPGASAGGGSGGGFTTEFPDSLFRIQDDVDPTKEIEFAAEGITTATARKITVPDHDVDLGFVGDNSTGSSGGATTVLDLSTPGYHSVSCTTDTEIQVSPGTAITGAFYIIYASTFVGDLNITLNTTDFLASGLHDTEEFGFVSAPFSTSRTWYGVADSTSTVRVFLDPTQAAQHLTRKTNVLAENGGVHLEDANFLDLPNGSGQFGLNDFSIQMVWKSSQHNSATYPVFYQSHNSDTDNSVWLRTETATNTLRVQFRDATSTLTSIDTGFPIPEDGVTRNMTFVFDRDNLLSIYVDGTLKHTEDISAHSTIDIGDSNTSDGRMGSSTASGGFMGDIYKFRAFNLALTAAQTLDIHLHGVPDEMQFGDDARGAFHTSDFSSTVDGWTAAGSASLAAVSSRLEVTMPASGVAGAILSASPWDAELEGKLYNFRFKHRIKSGSSNDLRLRNSVADANWEFIDDDSNQKIFTTTGTEAQEEWIIKIIDTGGGIYVRQLAAQSEVIEVYDFIVEQAGAIVDLDLGRGQGLFYPDFTTNDNNGTGTGIENLIERENKINVLTTASGTLTLDMDIYRGQRIRTANLTGTLTVAHSNARDGDEVELEVTDDGTTRTLAYTSITAMGTALITATTVSKTIVTVLQYRNGVMYGTQSEEV